MTRENAFHYFDKQSDGEEVWLEDIIVISIKDIELSKEPSYENCYHWPY